MGIILMQRKILPLHGSAVAIDGKAYAFIGESGAGKSTLAAAFMNKGYELMTDDIVAISFKHNEIPIVTPAYASKTLETKFTSIWDGIKSVSSNISKGNEIFDTCILSVSWE